MITALTSVGCQTTAQMMDSLQPQATSVATRRAQAARRVAVAAGPVGVAAGEGGASSAGR